MEGRVGRHDLGNFVQMIADRANCLQSWRIVKRRKDRGVRQLAQDGLIQQARSGNFRAAVDYSMRDRIGRSSLYHLGNFV